MPSEVEKNLPATNEGYGTQEYWCVVCPRPRQTPELTISRETRYTKYAIMKSKGDATDGQRRSWDDFRLVLDAYLPAAILG